MNGAWAAGRAVTEARMRARARLLGQALRNPFLLLGSALGFVFALVVQYQSRPGTGNGGTDPRTLSLSVTAAGVVAALVILTSRSSSPLRWTPADVAWPLMARNGPRILVTEQVFASSALTLVTSLCTAPVSLALQSRSPWHGLATAVAMATGVLLLRCLSLTSHLLALRSRPAARLTTVMAVLWCALWAGHRFIPGSLPEPLADTLAVADDKLVGMLVRAVLVPEHAAASPIALTAVTAVLWGLLLTRPANAFVEPAARAAYAGAEIRAALSERAGAGTTTMAGTGIRTGIPSWQRWPESPYAAISLRGWCHLRRRLRTELGFALTLTCATAGAGLVDPKAMAAPLALAIAARSLAAPSDSLAEDVSAHQHVWLAGLRPVPVTAAAALPGAATTTAVLAVPGFAAAIALGTPAWAVLTVLAGAPAIGALIVTAGAVSAVLTPHVLLRAAASLILSTAPVAIAVLAPLGYRTWQTTGVLAATLLLCCGLATSLYGLIVTAHLRSPLHH
ncbi:hypothetical protein J1792_32160 [Streptomyces triculaminicus]|uniref:Uncharacterized protein n=1 Tax=Streptomyces triculaminicus TaxID=2816232 RepID=A0A939FSR1_9ACTN|nr:hypothetical protein [Streptomyces triculaminicus]MBO0657203.1 hypothetical protein [Streptomyces triculaminicus]